MTSIKLKQVKINNIKNVVNGEIKSHVNFENINKGEVIGLYGQNGSGKTALVEGFKILKSLINLDKLPPLSAQLLTIGKDLIELSFQFLVNNTHGDFFVTYDCSLLPGRSNTMLVSDGGKQREATFQVLNEKLSYKENKPNKRAKVIIEKKSDEFYHSDMEQYNYGHASNNALKIRNRQVHDLPIDAQVGIRVALKDALLSSSSIIFHESMNDVYEKELNEVEYEIISNLRFDFNREFHIIDNVQNGYIISNIMVPFNIHIPGVRGIIPYGLTDDITLPKDAYSTLTNVIKQINIVLVNIIPGLEIRINKLYEKTLENGDSGITFEILSDKDNRKLPLRCESAGILRLISFLSTLIAVYNNPNACVVIDELDTGIFEYLLGELLEVINTNGKGQLIFTSHNLRILEVLPSKQLWFTTTNENNRFIQLKGIRELSNARDIYLRAVQLGGQNEEVYNETYSFKIKKSFRKAGGLNV